jgi:hypothetical protein
LLGLTLRRLGVISPVPGEPPVSASAYDPGNV